MYTTQPKKMLIMNILDILKKYTDEKSHKIEAFPTCQPCSNSQKHSLLYLTFYTLHPHHPREQQAHLEPTIFHSSPQFPGSSVPPTGRALHNFSLLLAILQGAASRPRDAPLPAPSSKTAGGTHQPEGMRCVG